MDYSNYIGNFVPTSVLPVATTPPPPIIDIKFKYAPYNINDNEDITFGRIELQFVYSEADKESHSWPTYFHIQIFDVDKDKWSKNYIQNAKNVPYRYWERYDQTKQNLPELDDSIVNGRIIVTPMNDYSQGQSAIYFLPFKDMIFLIGDHLNRVPATLVLSKYWNLYSIMPDVRYNRPKTMYIYMDVPIDDIIDDKEILSDDKYAYNTYGDWKHINQENFRWILNPDGNFKLNENNQVTKMTELEQEFIQELLLSINGEIIKFQSAKQLKTDEPYVFKIATIHPMDSNDSIIIYFMKGMRWRM